MKTLIPGPGRMHFVSVYEVATMNLQKFFTVLIFFTGRANTGSMTCKPMGARSQHVFLEANDRHHGALKDVTNQESFQ